MAKPSQLSGMKFADGLLFYSRGMVLDPVARRVSGVLPLPYNSLVEPDLDHDAVLALTPAGSTNWVLRGFDAGQFLETCSQTNGYAGSPRRLIRWGDNGVAVLTPSELRLMRTALISTGPEADLLLRVDAGQNNLTPGGPVSYTLSLTNLGPNPASGIRLTQAFSPSKLVDWIEPFEEVFRFDLPKHEWFVGGKLNAAANCIDRHVYGDRRNKAALIWVGEDGEEHTYTYSRLYREVNRFANALKRLGVAKGDRVIVYMPLVPEGVITMLACARIGTIHSVVFAGMGTQALRSRIVECQAKVIVCTDFTFRRGKKISLKPTIDEAVRDLVFVEHGLPVRPSVVRRARLGASPRS